MKLNWDKILEHVDPARRTEVKKEIEKNYLDVVTTNHPVVEIDGHLRFKQDPMTRWISEVAMSGKNGGPTLNDMNTACHANYGGKWSLKKVKQFHRDKGYSLDAFGEIFCSSRCTWRVNS